MPCDGARKCRVEGLRAVVCRDLEVPCAETRKCMRD